MPDKIHFAQPLFLYLLLIIPLFIIWYWFKQRKSKPEMQVSSIEAFKLVKQTLRQRLRHLLFAIRMLIYFLLIVALARPQSSSSRQDINIEGIDIMLATDISSSMLAEDLRPNRLEAAKNVAVDFIEGRPNDRIGLVVFSAESFTHCPLTTDHTVLKNLFKSIKTGMVEDGTAIGNGIATAVGSLKESKALSKVIILLTDGENNRGQVDPLTAAELAKLFKIRIYTVGVGTIGTAPYPFQTMFGIQYQNVPVKIDENLLQKLSAMTDGKYFRATNNRKLADIYKEIDSLEKSKIDVTVYSKKKEEFLPLALLAACLLILEILLRHTIFRSIP